MNSEIPMISIVVPCYNEGENINTLYQRLRDVLDRLNNRYRAEIIFVDDGSKDDTMNKLINIYEKDLSVKIISLSRNFGKEVALSAGLDFAQGDACIPLDADLQHPPELIPRLLEKWEEGYEIVNAKRVSRPGEPFLRRLSAKLFYRTIAKLSDVPIPENVGDFRLISARPLAAIRSIRERRRFMKGLVPWVGFKTTEIEFENEPRQRGKSKWSFLRLLNFALEGVTSFSIRPLQIATVMGLVISCLAFVYAVYIVLKTLIYGDPVKGFPTIIVTVLFLGGIQLLSLGIIGEYIGRVYEETKQRPIYIVKEYLSHGEHNRHC